MATEVQVEGSDGTPKNHVNCSIVRPSRAVEAYSMGFACPSIIFKVNWWSSLALE